VCTLLFWRGAWGAGTSTLAANRDEARDRPWGPPARRAAGERSALFPTDHRGGTWVGAHHGLLAALTNAPAPPAGGPLPGSRPSRGLLVREALAAGSADEALALVRHRVAGAPHEGFNLLVAGADGAAVLVHADGALAETELAPGLHVLDNHRLGTRHHLSEPAAGEAAPRPDEAPDAFLRRVVADVLARHEATAWTDHAPCRHGATRGTLCTTAIHLDPERPDRSAFLFAAGPPCTAPLRPHRLPDRLPLARPGAAADAGPAGDG